MRGQWNRLQTPYYLKPRQTVGANAVPVLLVTYSFYNLGGCFSDCALPLYVVWLVMAASVRGLNGQVRDERLS